MGGQYSAEQIAVMKAAYFNPLLVVEIMLFGAALSALGCWVGANLLRKHFIKSGL
ncbi:MptD family putative ECF transporter S component [Candidatus Oscillochloris fontis]|uniref:MptD family putative ECF transporter S component n=1 Tax=Candidatus Oscillochloris fontis TaxID=2496868 RepID=UPI003B82D1ED